MIQDPMRHLTEGRGHRAFPSSETAPAAAAAAAAATAASGLSLANGSRKKILISLEVFFPFIYFFFPVNTELLKRDSERRLTGGKTEKAGSDNCSIHSGICSLLETLEVYRLEFCRILNIRLGVNWQRSCCQSHDLGLHGPHPLQLDQLI